MLKQINPLPTPPDSTKPATFNADADTFVKALTPFANEANLLANELNELSKELNKLGADTNIKYQDLVAKYNDLMPKYDEITKKHNEVMSSFNTIAQDKAKIETIASDFTQKQTKMEQIYQQIHQQKDELERILNEGVINDKNLSTAQTWSSKKISDDINQITHKIDNINLTAIIDDKNSSLKTTYSSERIDTKQKLISNVLKNIVKDGQYTISEKYWTNMWSFMPPAMQKKPTNYSTSLDSSYIYALSDYEYEGDDFLRDVELKNISKDVRFYKVSSVGVLAYLSSNSMFFNTKDYSFSINFKDEQFFNNAYGSQYVISRSNRQQSMINVYTINLQSRKLDLAYQFDLKESVSNICIFRDEAYIKFSKDNKILGYRITHTQLETLQTPHIAFISGNSFPELGFKQDASSMVYKDYIIHNNLLWSRDDVVKNIQQPLGFLANTAYLKLKINNHLHCLDMNKATETMYVHHSPGELKSFLYAFKDKMGWIHFIAPNVRDCKAVPEKF